MNNRYVIIMAGGVGSRFWPLSRREKPKQFLDILGTGETLLQATYRRFKNVCPEKNIFVVTNAEHESLVTEQLGIDPSRVLGEPFRRNTAPCIAYGTFRILKENPSAVIAVTPADHLIVKEERFCEVIKDCFKFASKNDGLVTIGVKPDRPETGYGYIQADKKKPVKDHANLLKVKTFTEKPDLDLARVFLESGDFFWNSGIFIWNMKSILAAFEKHMPDTYQAFDEGRDLYATGNERSFIGKTYAECRSISIDYGIMEKADNVHVMTSTDIGWSDLGTWGSLYEHSAADKNGNAVVRGEIFSYENTNSIFNIAPGKIAVIQGLKDYIVIDAEDVLLIVSKNDEQKIRQYLDHVKKSTGEKFQ